MKKLLVLAQLRVPSTWVIPKSLTTPALWISRFANLQATKGPLSGSLSSGSGSPATPPALQLGAKLALLRLAPRSVGLVCSTINFMFSSKPHFTSTNPGTPSTHQGQLSTSCAYRAASLDESLLPWMAMWSREDGYQAGRACSRRLTTVEFDLIPRLSCGHSLVSTLPTRSINGEISQTGGCLA